MSERVVVPEGMLKAAYDGDYGSSDGNDLQAVEGILKDALLWLSENPIVPTDEQCDALYTEGLGRLRAVQFFAVEWQRRMFRAPEPEVPEAVKDLLDPFDPKNQAYANQHIIEAYRRGLRDK